jgi:thymidylate kinase
VFGQIGVEMDATENQRWVVIDAAGSMENVTRDVWAEVEPLLGGVPNEVERLWV